MEGLLKRDFINYKSVIIMVAILIPIGFVLSVPPFVMSLGLLLPVLVISVFYSDHHSSINRFMVSLPIKRSKIVFSRYLSIFIIWIGTILYQSLIGHLFDYFVPYPIFAFGWKDILVLISLGLNILTIMVPLYYLFKSFILPTIIFFIGYFNVFIFFLDALVNISGMGNENEIIFNYLDTWIVPLIESVITFYPFLLLPVLAFGFLYLSMKLSEKIFHFRREI